MNRRSFLKLFLLAFVAPFMGKMKVQGYSKQDLDGARETFLPLIQSDEYGKAAMNQYLKGFSFTFPLTFQDNLFEMT